MKNTRKKETLIYHIPVFVILTVLPLFLRLYEFDNGLSAYAWNAERDSSMDLFLHGKMVLFEMTSAVCLVLLFIYLMRANRMIRLPKIFSLLAGYAVLALVSTLFSDYRSLGFSGIDEQFENVFCLLGYVFMIIYIYILVQNFKHIRLLLHGLLAGSLAIGLIGVLQFIGRDPVVSSLFQQLYIPISLKGTNVSLNFALGTVYMTLYNPDYVGLYTALVCPILLALFFYSNEKIVRILSMLSFIMLIVGTVGAGVLSGYIGLGVTLLVFLVLLMKKIIESKRNLLVAGICVAAFALLVSGTFALQKAILFSTQTELSAQGSESESPAVTESTLAVSSHTDYRLETITETDDYVAFCYDGITFRETMRVEDGIVYLDFTDTERRPLLYDYNEQDMTYTLTEPGLTGITSYSAKMLDTYIGFVTVIDGKNWMFTYTYKDDVLSYYTVNTLGHLDKNITSRSAVFTKRYDLFNGRGYIWAKTIPLLKDYLILGSGADSFSLVFPQSDYVSAYKGGYENMIISKPHCAFMQIAIQTGLLSLIFLFGFYLWYVIECLRLYFWKKIQTLEQALAAAIFAGTAGFMVISLVNDSTIGITPVFVVLLGLGIVINRMNKNKDL